MTVLRKGTPHGLNVIIPAGGHWAPNSTLGANLEWKNAQKKDRKKNTSDVINSIIPQRKPFTTISVCNPWKDLSREISRHQVNAVIIIIVNLTSIKFKLTKWNHFAIPTVKPRANTETIMGQGDSSVRWKGWHKFDNISVIYYKPPLFYNKPVKSLLVFLILNYNFFIYGKFN